jgi:N-formylglutamate amidohydrolase
VEARGFLLHEGGDVPLVAAAIHDGHAVRAEVADALALTESKRLREEDPFTGGWTVIAPTRILGMRSRFEVDLNRPRDYAVYRRPEDAWGLHVWKREPPAELIARSLAEYDRFYDEVRALLSRTARRHGRFVVYDLHSYNHRRDGPEAPAADPEANPEVNVGTGSLDRRRWAPVVDALLESLRAFDYRGRRLDVRENVKFRGGHFSRWVHESFPAAACSLAIEFKKFFMDEWSGEPDPVQLDAIRKALASTVPAVLEALRRM